MNSAARDRAPSIIHGTPLAEEKSLGALTLSGYLREVTTRCSSGDQTKG